jgi:hypothetical protein
MSDPQFSILYTGYWSLDARCWLLEGQTLAFIEHPASSS